MNSNFTKVNATASGFTFRRERSGSLPVVDQYGDYKSDSQIYFSNKLDESRKWSLWLTVVFIILMWNVVILSLQETPIITDYIDKNVRCKIPHLENINWTFDEIKRIFHYSNVTGRCYYYDHDYKHLAQQTYEEAYNTTQSFNKVKIEKCKEHMLRFADPRFNYLEEFDLICSQQMIKMSYFVFIGEVVGFTSSGLVSDIYGRRMALIGTLPLTVFSCILRAIVQSYWWMYVFTAVALACLNGAVLIGTTLQIVHRKRRAFMIAFMWFGASIAGLLKVALCVHLDRLSTTRYQWIINCTLLLPICTEWLVPESPHWLVCRRDWRNMRNLLDEINYPKHLPPFSDVYENTQPLPLITTKGIMSTLLKPAFRKKLLLGGFLFSLTYYLFNTESSRIISIMDSTAKYSAIEGICVIINMGLIFLMLRCTSRPMCICYCLLILALFYCAATIYKPYSEAGGVVACICLLIAQNATLVNNLLLTETFPTRVRTTALGICKSAATIIVIVSTIIQEFTNVEEAVGTYWWTIHAALMLIGAFI